MRPSVKDETLKNALLAEEKRQWGDTVDVYNMPPMTFQSLKLGIIDNFLIQKINDLVDNESLFNEYMNFLFTGEVHDTGVQHEFDAHHDYYQGYKVWK